MDVVAQLGPWLGQAGTWLAQNWDSVVKGVGLLVGGGFFGALLTLRRDKREKAQQFFDSYDADIGILREQHKRERDPARQAGISQRLRDMEEARLAQSDAYRASLRLQAVAAPQPIADVTISARLETAPSDAEQLLQASSALGPSIASADNYLARGQLLITLGRPADALAEFTKAAEIAPENAFAWNNRAVMLGELRRHREALESIDRAIRLQPNDATYHANRSSQLLLLERAPEALAAADRALRMEHGNLIGRVNRANALITLDRLREAESEVRGIIRDHPEVRPARHGLARILLQEERWAEAVDALTNELSIGPPHVHAYVDRGEAELRLGFPAAALIDAESALAMDAEDGHALSIKANALGDLGRYEQADATFERLLTLRPGDIRAIAGRAASLFELGRLQEAIAMADEALAIDPRYSVAMVNRAAALDKLGRYDEAVATLTAAAQARPDDPTIYSNRALTLEKLGRLTEASADVDRAVLLDPTHRNALKLRAHLKLEGGSGREALTDLVVLVGRTADDVGVLIAFARHSALSADADGAEVWIRRAIELNREVRDDIAASSEFDWLRSDPTLRNKFTDVLSPASTEADATSGSEAP
jgi:tetratricopeptide (TPR) repeat protein